MPASASPPPTTDSERREALTMRRADAMLAMSEARRHPWLCAGLDSSILPSMREAPPAWIPKAGERMAAKGGSYLVLRRECIQAATPWPWLLCALEPSARAPDAPARPTLGAPSFPSELAEFSRRAFVYCSLLCWKEGRGRQCVDEMGCELRLVAAIDLARAAAAVALAPKLAGMRLSKARPTPDSARPGAVAAGFKDTESA